MKHARKNLKTRSQPKAKRMSITVPPDHHDELSRMADQKKVSVAWLVREAVEKYLATNAPLFASKE
ncbi:MAG: ribbon-helix-helix protein, CopG family [Phycisphaerales bacterium]|nr:ribbon-helix-helix protein, CopG family [Phycisphaerales bacterium]